LPPALNFATSHAQFFHFNRIHGLAITASANLADQMHPLELWTGLAANL